MCSNQCVNINAYAVFHKSTGNSLYSSSVESVKRCEKRRRFSLIYPLPAALISDAYAHHETHYFFFFFLGLHLWHMEVPWLGVESELQLPAFATAIAMPDLSLLGDLHHSLWQCLILIPLIKARSRTHILTVTMLYA